MQHRFTHILLLATDYFLFYFFKCGLFKDSRVSRVRDILLEFKLDFSFFRKYSKLPFDPISWRRMMPLQLNFSLFIFKCGAASRRTGEVLLYVSQREKNCFVSIHLQVAVKFTPHLSTASGASNSRTDRNATCVHQLQNLWAPLLLQGESNSLTQ